MAKHYKKHRVKPRRLPGSSSYLRVLLVIALLAILLSASLIFIFAKQFTNEQTEVEQPIHFEFYTTLPNMQVPSKPVIEKNTDVSVAPAPAPVLAPVKPIAKLTPVVNQEELERELSAEIKK